MWQHLLRLLAAQAMSGRIIPERRPLETEDVD
jgi:hypothetical protein